MITKYFTEKGPGKGSANRENITIMCPGLFAIASSGFTHTDMVKQIYKQFGIYNEYVVGVQAGPLFKAWFTGMEYVSLSQTLTPILSVSHMTLTAVERRRLLLLNQMQIGLSSRGGFSLREEKKKRYLHQLILISLSLTSTTFMPMYVHRFWCYCMWFLILYQSVPFGLGDVPTSSQVCWPLIQWGIFICKGQ